MAIDRPDAGHQILEADLCGQETPLDQQPMTDDPSVPGRPPGELHGPAAFGGPGVRAETARQHSRELHSKIHLDLADALALLDQVTSELDDARDKIANLEIALQSSRRIGQALGIMMDRLAVTEDEAFTRLRMASQRSHRKLRDIAEEIVYTGQIPPAAA